MLHSHIFEAKDILVRQELEQFDLSQCCNRELTEQSVNVRGGKSTRLNGSHTPSFSWCMMIFFSATIAPDLRDRAR